MDSALEFRYCRVISLRNVSSNLTFDDTISCIRRRRSHGEEIAKAEAFVVEPAIKRKTSEFMVQHCHMTHLARWQITDISIANEYFVCIDFQHLVTLPSNSIKSVFLYLAHFIAVIAMTSLLLLRLISWRQGGIRRLGQLAARFPFTESKIWSLCSFTQAK